MKRHINLILVGLFILFSCDKEDASTIEIAKALEGEWSVNETSQYYKNPSIVYQVTISKVSGEESQIAISNFYQLGFETNVIGVINGGKIEFIENQAIATSGISTYTILSGTGNISSDYQSIDWNYQVDQGSGQIDDAEAVYTKL